MPFTPPQFPSKQTGPYHVIQTRRLLLELAHLPRAQGCGAMAGVKVARLACCLPSAGEDGATMEEELKKRKKRNQLKKQSSWQRGHMDGGHGRTEARYILLGRMCAPPCAKGYANIPGPLTVVTAA